MTSNPNNNVSTYPWIGEPKVHIAYEGIAVTFKQLEEAIYTMAAERCEEDWDAVEAVVAEARMHLTNGRDRMPDLASAIMSSGLPGANSVNRELLDVAFVMSGEVVPLFEHGHYGRPTPWVLRDLQLTAYPVTRDIYVLEIWEHRSDRPFARETEKALAEALGVERVIRHISITFPLEVVDGTRFRFDFVPFMGALERVGMLGIEYAETDSMTGKAAADRFWTRVNRGTSQYDAPSFTFVSPSDLGVEVSMGAYGCHFIDYDQWERERTVHCTREGTVFSGPLQHEHCDSDQLMRPIMSFTLQRPRREGGPRWPAMATPELKEPILKLAEAIVHEVRR